MTAPTSTKALTRASKFIALILRHDPAAGGLTLDAEGWAPVDQVVAALRQHDPAANRAMLDQIVADDAKGRYNFSADGARIRANQGHSVAVDLGLLPATPPALLYHGTVARVLDAIRAEGLRPMQRQHVHLSPDTETATIVGRRRGVPLVLAVRAGDMHAAGTLFYRSENGVWLTGPIPPEWITWPAAIPPTAP